MVLRIIDSVDNLDLPVQELVSAAGLLATRYGRNASFAPLAEAPGVGPPATT
jgi:hypothetical protein